MTTLTDAWTEASTALPPEWEIWGVARLDRAPYEWGVAGMEGTKWVAAAGPWSDSVIAGYGDDPAQALVGLAEALASLPRDATGNVASAEPE